MGVLARPLGDQRARAAIDRILRGERRAGSAGRQVHDRRSCQPGRHTSLELGGTVFKRGVGLQPGSGRVAVDQRAGVRVQAQAVAGGGDHADPIGGRVEGEAHLVHHQRAQAARADRLGDGGDRVDHVQLPRGAHRIEPAVGRPEIQSDDLLSGVHATDRAAAGQPCRCACREPDQPVGLRGREHRLRFQACSLERGTARQQACACKQRSHQCISCERCHEVFLTESTRNDTPSSSGTSGIHPAPWMGAAAPTGCHDLLSYLLGYLLSCLRRGPYCGRRPARSPSR